LFVDLDGAGNIALGCCLFGLTAKACRKDKIGMRRAFAWAGILGILCTALGGLVVEMGIDARGMFGVLGGKIGME
jgi:hypothetical protein